MLLLSMLILTSPAVGHQTFWTVCMLAGTDVFVTAQYFASPRHLYHLSRSLVQALLPSGTAAVADADE